MARTSASSATGSPSGSTTTVVAAGMSVTAARNVAPAMSRATTAPIANSAATAIARPVNTSLVGLRSTPRRWVRVKLIGPPPRAGARR